MFRKQQIVWCHNGDKRGCEYRLGHCEKIERHVKKLAMSKMIHSQVGRFIRWILNHPSIRMSICGGKKNSGIFDRQWILRSTVLPNIVNKLYSDIKQNVKKIKIGNKITMT